MSTLPTPIDHIEIVPRSSTSIRERISASPGPNRTPRSSQRSSPYPSSRRSSPYPRSRRSSPYPRSRRSSPYPSSRRSSRQSSPYPSSRQSSPFSTLAATDRTSRLIQSRSPSPASSLSSLDTNEDEQFWIPESDSDQSIIGNTASTSRSFSHSHTAVSENEIPPTTTASLSGAKDTGAIRTVRFAESADPPVAAAKDANIPIPKPSGEVSRPGRGGYNLLNVLGWRQDHYRAVQKFINRLVDEHLDCEQSLRRQSSVNVKKVQELAMNKYPVFEEYEDHWPINDFVRNHLKTRKAAIKNEKLEKMAAEMEKQKATEDARKVGDQEVGNAANATARVSKTGNVAHPRHGRK